MLKHVNIFVLVVLLFSCKKEQVVLPKYSDADVSFLYGEWEWDMSISGTNLSIYFHDYKYAETSEDIHCTLKFNPNGVLEVVSSSENYTLPLKVSGLTELDDLKIVSFRTEANELIKLTYCESLNQLTTEKAFFTFSQKECNLNFSILSSTYEKI